MSLTDFLKFGRLCQLSNQYIWIAIPIKYYFRNSCINLIVDLLLCLFWKQLFNLNSLTNLSKFDHKKIWLIHSSYLRLDCFWIKDALSILTLWVQSRRGILVQTCPKNSSRTVGKSLGGYGLCKFPYLRMSPLYLIYGLNFGKHDCTISLQFRVIDYLFKFPKWWLRIKFLVKGHNSSLYLSYSMMTGTIFSKRSLSVRKMEAIIGTTFLKNP